MADKLLLSTKLKNEIKKIPGDYTFYLKNIKINGITRGCSGFVRNNKNNTYVYVDTERCVYKALPNYMYRYANNEKDYKGYRNRWADTVPELVHSITKLLESDPITERDSRV